VLDAQENHVQIPAWNFTNDQSACDWSRYFTVRPSLSASVIVRDGESYPLPTELIVVIEVPSPSSIGALPRGKKIWCTVVYLDVAFWTSLHMVEAAKGFGNCKILILNNIIALLECAKCQKIVYVFLTK
jgi:hypothetical protein